MSIDIHVGTETLVEKQCRNCGIWFAVPDWFEEEQKKNGPRGGWYCPNGHQRHYLQGEQEKDEIARLKKLVAAERTRVQWERDQREATERSLSAQKGQVTKLKKRASAGVCPCCNRQFQNVKLHMSKKHPEEVKAHGIALEQHPAEVIGTSK